MAILDKNRVYDGWQSLAAGVDSGRRPSLIEKNQCWKARNVAFRGGVPKTRPGFPQLELTFENTLYYDSAGNAVGPGIVTDAMIIDAGLFSKTAVFTPEDVGSEVIDTQGHIALGTTISVYNSARNVTLSAFATGSSLADTVTIVRRTNPPSFSAVYEGVGVVSATANFTPADVGKTITGGSLPAGTFITRFVNATGVEINNVVSLGGPSTLTIVGRVPNRSSSEAFALEPFQTACYYAPAKDNECIMATLGGRLFQITPLEKSARIREIDLGTRNRRTTLLNYMVQADKYHITQDGAALPIIFNGVTARRATLDEVVVGKAMAYGVGRLVVTRDRDVIFGDLYGSHIGDPADSVLKFTETVFLSEGGAAHTPYTQGEITAVTFFPSQDTATGQGELVVFTEHGAVTFDLHIPREQWKQSSFQQIGLINSTARGHRAIAILNSDLWIRDDPGWRAYRQARSQATGWYQLPQSTEVTPWTELDTHSLLAFGSAINFDNRLIVTVNPVPNQGRLYHKGLLALDFDVLSSFGQASRPAWDGHWGNLRVLQIVAGSFKGRNRAFAFGLDDSDSTQIYEISLDKPEDFDGPITSEIEFASYDFNSPFNEKGLYGCDVWVDEVKKSTTMDLSFKSDSNTEYVPWKTFQEVPAKGNCGELTCGMVPTIRDGFAPRLRAPKPDEDCDDYTSRMLRRGYEFQPKLRWTGHAAIVKMRLQAMQVEEDPKAIC